MIIPSGKRKHQVNQGINKNQSIWDYDVFKDYKETLSKVALAPTSPDKIKSDVQAPEATQPQPQTTQVPEGNAELNAVMSDSNSSKLNPDNIQTNQEQQGSSGMNDLQQLEQQLSQNHSPREARILVKFLEELRQADMLAPNFMPDPMRTQFIFGGGGIELKMPRQQGLPGKLVSKQ